MLLTSFQVIRLPEPYAKKMGYKVHGSIEYNEGIDIVAWLNGEDICKHTFDNNVSAALGETFASKLLSLGAKKPIENDSIDLLSNDDKVVTMSRSYLRRRFHLIDDYLSDFPEPISITLPFSAREIAESIRPNLNPTSPIHTDCLHYLNPKDPMYYFLRTTVSTPPITLRQWGSLLSEEQKTGLITTRRSRQDSDGTIVHLPNEGRGDAYLAYIFEIHEDIANLIAAFTDYPSYLTLYSAMLGRYGKDNIVKQFATNTFFDLITKSDYSKSNEMGGTTSRECSLICHSIDAIIMETDSKEIASRLLAMRGKRHTYFENLQLDVTTPYLEKYRNYFSVNDYSPILVNLSRMFGLSTAIIASVFM